MTTPTDAARRALAEFAAKHNTGAEFLIATFSFSPQANAQRCADLAGHARWLYERFAGVGITPPPPPPVGIVDDPARRLYREAVLTWLGAQSVQIERFGTAPEPRADDVPPDGPGTRFRFYWRGVSIGFESAPLRFRLLESLWDRERNRPRDDIEEGAAMRHVYGNDREQEDAFKGLAKEVNRAMEEAAMGLRVKRAAGRVWLEVLPD